MTDPPTDASGRWWDFGRLLEIQTLGLNLPFALAFIFIASKGLPSLATFLLIVIAFLAARNAGHSFNRWADRAQDAVNPRTQNRVLVTGRARPEFALAFSLASAALLIVVSYFLNPLAFYLSPVALAMVYGYTYTKRITAWTTPFLGLVEAIVPAAVFIAVQGTLPPVALLAVGGLLLWGTAFETIHSLGDLASDRALELHSLPLLVGVRRSTYLVPVLHAGALILLAAFGFVLGLGIAYPIGLAAIAMVAVITDYQLLRHTAATRVAFRRHFLMSAIYLVGAAVAIFIA
ncbi:MAG TPA: UbiA family prenyltransferase [Thermoplasmata archaeon]|nr:UbiA family prenyltransferase [Thermoplasmata archaeon]